MKSSFLILIPNISKYVFQKNILCSYCYISNHITSIKHLPWIHLFNIISHQIKYWYTICFFFFFNREINIAAKLHVSNKKLCREKINHLPHQMLWGFVCFVLFFWEHGFTSRQIFSLLSQVLVSRLVQTEKCLESSYPFIFISRMQEARSLCFYSEKGRKEITWLPLQ